jgi:tetratricopeptide (TPR) repeat protein
MKFLNEFRSGFIYGKGLKCLKKNNYASAAAFFEKACSINPEYRKKGYATYYLGLCYYKLGDKRKAKEEMSIAFNVLHKKVVNEKNQRDIEYFNALSNAYIQLLNEFGESNSANNITHTVELTLGDNGVKP